MAETSRQHRAEIGAVEQHVIDNISDIRQARGWSWRELSEQLAALGHPIVGLARVGRGERRVDAGDLVALALALRVNVSALILPRNRSNDALIELTPKISQRSWICWQWADGSIPLPDSRVDSGVEEVVTPWDQAVDFQTYARPHSGVPHTHEALREIYNLTNRVRILIEDFGNPDMWDLRDEYITRSMQVVALKVEELLAENRRLGKERQQRRDSRQVALQVEKTMGAPPLLESAGETTDEKNGSE